MTPAETAFTQALTAAGFDAWNATYGPQPGYLATDPAANAAMVASQFLGSHPEALSALEPAFIALVAQRPELGFRLDAARAMAAQHAGAPQWPFKPTPQPAAPFGSETYEVPAIQGVQQWAVRDSVKPLASLQAQRTGDVSVYRAGKVASGFTVSGQVVDIDDGARADLTSMMAAANASLITLLSGTAKWPSNYASGWVTRANTLIPLPSATDGIKLATAALNYYSALVQREAALAKAINAATTLAALRAIDITAGWPSAS